MQISDIIEIISIITSLFTSIVAIIISVKTLKQSEQTLEETTRPYVCVYGAVNQSWITTILSCS